MTGTSTYTSKGGHGRTVDFRVTAGSDQINVPAPMDDAAGQLEPGVTIVVRYWRGAPILIRTPRGQGLHGQRYPIPVSLAALVIGNLVWLPIVLILGVLALALAVDAWSVGTRRRSWFCAAGDRPVERGWSWFVADRRRARVGVAGACALVLICYVAALIAFEWSRQWTAGLLVGTILPAVVAVLIFRWYVRDARANAATPPT